MIIEQPEALWAVRDQAVRLEELVSDDPAVKELPLRRDVRSLGVVLGNVLREQAGDDLLRTVEDVRRLVIAAREEENGPAATPAAPTVQPLIAGCSVAECYRLARAFSAYFELTNLAETNHRKRRRRASQVLEKPPERGTLAGTLAHARKAGLSAGDALQLLERVEVVPVFTAHPTEVARRTVLFKRRRIARALERLDVLPLTRPAAAAGANAIAAEVASLWQSDEVHRRRVTLRDEINMGLDYFRIVVDSLPAVYEALSSAFAHAFGSRIAPNELPRVLRFGSWIGGDRDGNPFVTPQAMRDALEGARRLIVSSYVTSVADLMDRLSSSTAQEPVTAQLLERLRAYSERYPQVNRDNTTRSAAEVMRLFLDFVLFRLRQLRGGVHDAAYASAAEFRADLQVLRDNLCAHNGERLAALWLDPVIRQVDTFGFSLYSLDVRAHAATLETAVKELRAAPKSAIGESTSAALESMRAVAALKNEFPPDSIRSHVISGARKISSTAFGWRGLAVCGRRVLRAIRVSCRCRFSNRSRIFGTPRKCAAVCGLLQRIHRCWSRGAAGKK
jgi:phosphoenolpyruvate carboxylase